MPTLQVPCNARPSAVTAARHCPRPGPWPIALWTMTWLAAVAGGGCTSLTPHSEVRESVAAGNWVEIDDRQVYVEQQGEGPAVLLLHGFAASSHSWRKLAPLLRDDCRLIAPDLHGFGWTERPRQSEAYAPEGQLAMLTALLDTLEVRECLVVGHSYGGGLALLLAQEQPQRVAGLALLASVDPYARGRAAGPADGGRQQPRGLAARGSVALGHTGARLLLASPSLFRRALRHAYADPSMITPEWAEAYRARLLVEGFGDAWQGFAQAGGRWPRMQPDRIPGTTPVVAVAGLNDRIVPADAVRRLAERWPHGRWQPLEDVGHMPMEEAPEAVAAAIRQVLLLAGLQADQDRGTDDSQGH